MFLIKLLSFILLYIFNNDNDHDHDSDNDDDNNNKKLLDEVFVVFGIIKVEVSVRDLDYFGYHKNRI